MLKSLLMQGRNIQRHKTAETVSGELDDLALTTALKRFVEESTLSIPKIASLMGVFSTTLSMWIAGTIKPSRAELLTIKCFLEQRG